MADGAVDVAEEKEEGVGDGVEDPSGGGVRGAGGEIGGVDGVGEDEAFEVFGEGGEGLDNLDLTRPAFAKASSFAEASADETAGLRLRLRMGPMGRMGPM